MITIEIDGIRYNHFQNVSISHFLDSIADEFTITATAKESKGFPIRQRATCRALINDVPVVTGFIETIGISYDVSSYTIDISGSDKTVDVVDTTCAERMTFKGGLTLKKLIELSLEKTGVTGISVKSEVPESRLTPFKDNEIEAAETGETVFSFIEKHARKKNVLLTSDGNGDIVITLSSSEMIDGLQLINRVNDPRNNIISASRTLDDKQRFNKYIFKSQDAPNEALGSIDTDQMTNKAGQAIDSEVRESRVLRMQSESVLDATELKERAAWEADIRRIRSESYEAVISGHTIPGTLTPIPINKLIKIDDVLANINSVMLINRVVYSLSNNNCTTTLGLVNKTAYTRQAEFSAFEKRSNKESLDFKLDI